MPEQNTDIGLQRYHPSDTDLGQMDKTPRGEYVRHDEANDMVTSILADSLRDSATNARIAMELALVLVHTSRIVSILETNAAQSAGKAPT